MTAARLQIRARDRSSAGLVDMHPRCTKAREPIRGNTIKLITAGAPAPVAGPRAALSQVPLGLLGLSKASETSWLPRWSKCN